LKQAFRDTLGLPLCESYGQSELGGFVGLWAPDQPITDERLLSCGRPLPDKEVRVLDDDGAELPVGSIGELSLRGGFMAGYWNRPDKTAETLRGGWLHTGDVGFTDADGYVFMRGRLSERLTIAGIHWYPRDVEEVLMRHPSVREAALVGLADAVLGHRPVAFVTARDGYSPETQSLVEFAAQGLGRPVPSMTVEVLDSMPMTPTGKISKAQLLALVEQG
jgi:acyl-coenzyme A synthetase/AMP-(fatty) acid ligase